MRWYEALVFLAIMLAEVIYGFLLSFKVRVAFVGYRDHSDGSDRIVSIDLTDDTSSVVTFMSSVRATGGADTCEDIFGGLECVIGLGWYHCYISCSSLTNVNQARVFVPDNHSQSSQIYLSKDRSLPLSLTPLQRCFWRLRQTYKYQNKVERFLGDKCSSIFGLLISDEEIVNMDSRKNPNRVLIHVGDAPQHGSRSACFPNFCLTTYIKSYIIVLGRIAHWKSIVMRSVTCKPLILIVVAPHIGCHSKRCP